MEPLRHRTKGDTPYKRTFIRRRKRWVFPMESSDEIDHDYATQTEETDFKPVQMTTGFIESPAVVAPSQSCLIPDPRVGKGFRSGYNLDFSGFSLSSPEIFKGDESASALDVELDMLPLPSEVMNSTLLNSSSAMDLNLYHSPNISPIADASTVIYNSFGEVPMSLGPPEKHGVLGTPPKKDKKKTLAASAVMTDEPLNLCVKPKRTVLPKKPVLFDFQSNSEKELFFHKFKRRAYNLKSLTSFPGTLCTARGDA